MAADGDSRDDEERTRIGGAPPKLPLPKQDTPPAADAGVGDSTRIAPSRAPASIPPPSVGKPPPAAEGELERTRIATGPPAAALGVAPAAAKVASESQPMQPTPPVPEAPAIRPPAAAAPPPPPANVPDSDLTITAGSAASTVEERTIVLAPRPDTSMRLERWLQGAACEVIELDRATLILGRGHGSDVELRTPTASRQHARLSFHGGHWTLAPMERKLVLVDGARLSEGGVRLRAGMRLRLGDDEFQVIDTVEGTVLPVERPGIWQRLTAALRRLFGRRG